MQIEGDLPAELQGGTLFGVGPGLTRAYGSRVRNPSDGDGMIWSLAISSLVKTKNGASVADDNGEGRLSTDMAYGPGSTVPGSAIPGSAVSESPRMFFRNRFVRTGSFSAEQLAGRRLSRGIHDRGAPAAAEATGLTAQLRDFLSRLATSASTANGSKGNAEGEWVDDGVFTSPLLSYTCKIMIL